MLGTLSAFDVVILDLGLPERGMGLFAATALCVHKEVSLPVWVLTAGMRSVTAVAGCKPALDDYLVKALDLRELMLRVCMPCAARQRPCQQPSSGIGALVYDPSGRVVGAE